MNERICNICLAYMYTPKLVGWYKCGCCGNMKKASNSMITLQEILMNRANFDELSEEIQANGKLLLESLNKFRTEYGHPMIVTSGLRLPEDNAAANGSPTSAHMTLQACDFKDIDGKLFEFIKADPAVLDRCDLYMENPGWTKNWIHLQIRHVSHRIFLPYSDGRPATAPDREIKQ